MKNRLSWISVLLPVLGCASAQKTASPTPAKPAAQVAGPAGAPQAPAPDECPCRKNRSSGTDSPAATAPRDHAFAAVPVTAFDPTWGDADAPVTLVEFSDFECPYCARVQETIEELKRVYGPEKLRVVWKNYPLQFHENAMPAANAAMSVFAIGGKEAFWKFHHLAFSNQDALSADQYLAWAAQAGVDRDRFVAQATDPSQPGKRKVDSDTALARRLAIRGTPTFLINGIALSGAQPIDRFRAVIASQLAAAEALRSSGAAHEVYPILCARNLSATPAVPVAPAQAEAKPNQAPQPKVTVFPVPVTAEDPALGPADALVTLVVLSDFQCPDCEKLSPVLAGLAVKYGRDLRIVWKDYPVPAHENAVPAAVLARVALAKKGVGGFWKAHDALFARKGDLGEAALKRVAKDIGVGWSEVRKALADRRFQPVFDRSRELAEKVGVEGTPTSFVNGRKLTVDPGQEPKAQFVALIDSELAKAKAMVTAGQAPSGLYETITKTGAAQGASDR